MKHVLKTVALTATIALSATSALAVTDSFNFDIQGTVPESCEAINNNISAVEVVDLNISSPQRVGRVTYDCNVYAGFTRTVTSTNAGTLNAENGLQKVDYLFSHTGSFGLNQSPVQLNTPISESFGGSIAFATGQTGAVRIHIPSIPDNLMADTYSDTITIEVTSN